MRKFLEYIVKLIILKTTDCAQDAAEKSELLKRIESMEKVIEKQTSVIAALAAKLDEQNDERKQDKLLLMGRLDAVRPRTA